MDPAGAQADYWHQRLEMVERQLRDRGVRDERVLDAMLRLPRHKFVDPHLRKAAYEDQPLPIPAGQTISQPYIVAVMTEALALTGTEKLLEVGTGCGYQTALLAMLAERVYSIEREPELVELARRNLASMQSHGLLDAGRVEFIEADGTEGYAPGAPYDCILVAAAAPFIPPCLSGQLAEGGRLVIPIGDRNTQDLLLVRKIGDRLVRRVVAECRFVPLIGKFGWRD